jgi:AraC-like DNA-binding protein
MDNFYCNILDQIGVFASFITSLILFFKTTGSQRHANRLLAVVIFSWGWYALIYLMVIWGILKDHPHFFRIGSPLYYLIAPCAYMYVRSILFDETRFRKWDWLNFLPAVLNLIELIPFYLEDTESKRKAVEAVGSNVASIAYMGSGLIPALWHFHLRALLGIIYLFPQWQLLARFFKSSRAQAFRQFPSMKGWLVSFTCLISLLCIGLVWQSLILLIKGRSALALHAPNQPAIIFISLSFVWLSCYLLFKPDILYGIIRVDPADRVFPVIQRLPVPEAPPVKPPKPPVDEYRLQDYANQIGDAITKEALFKKKGLTLAALAQELSIPAHHLSYMLRHFYQQQFNDFINQYRVNYIKEIMCTEVWIKMTLDAHATDAGFSSRSTFFAVFKKQTGLTPTEYARQLNIDSPAFPDDLS